MDPALLQLLIPFVLITSAAGATLIFWRKAVERRQAASLEHAGGGATLSTLPQGSSVVTSSNPLVRFDQWFGRLVFETGMEMTPASALLLAMLVGLALGGGLLLWHDDLLTAALGLTVGVLLTIIVYLVRRSRRREQIRETLPAAMELMARAVRAGESLDQAIDLVGEMMAPPIGIEFRRCGRQLQMGLSMDGAMRALVQRVPLPEMRILAATLIIQRQTGGNLPVTLERLAKVIRDRISFHRQFRAATASGRISTLLIALAGPCVALYLFIWQREYIQRLIDTPQGQTLLFLALGLQCLGLLWIYRLLKTDY